MIYSFNIGAQLMRELPENELDNLVKDLWSFKTVARTSGKLFDKPNYIFNVYDETDFNDATDKFIGVIRVYFETNTRDVVQTIDQIATILAKYDAEIVQLIRKFKVLP